MSNLTLIQNPISTLDHVADNLAFGRFSLLRKSQVVAVGKPKHCMANAASDTLSCYFTVLVEHSRQYHVSLPPIERSLLADAGALLEKVRLQFCETMSNGVDDFICLGRGKVEARAA